MEYGPFDVIHFNHLEGIPASVLSLKEFYPKTRFIFSMHDYYTFCPQVNLLFENRMLCSDNQSGEKCLECLPIEAYPFGKRMLSTFVDKTGLNTKGVLGKFWVNSDFLKSVFSLINFREPDRNWEPRDIFREWKQFIELINENVDRVLAVSERVKQIAIEKGIDPSKIQTFSNPVPEANRFDSIPQKVGPIVSGDFCTMVFMGYMNHIKGFYFLLDAFEQMQDSLSRKISLVIPAKKSHDSETLTRLEKLSRKLKSLVLHDGYEQNELDRILEGCDLGLLCHVWQEPGPLTALELHVRRVPFLTSHLGGAPEVAKCSRMVFQAGNIQDFLSKVEIILDGKVTHEEYWKNASRVMSIEEHFDKLLKVHYFNDV